MSATRSAESTTSAIRVGPWSDPAGWERFVTDATDATVMHRWAWGDILQTAYGHETIRLAATDADRIVGVLPLTMLRSRVFGRRLVSMPFMDYGGVCASSDVNAARALVDQAIEIAQRERAVMELRHIDDVPIGLPSSLEKVTMLLELQPDEETQWRALSSERRNRIRKGQRLGTEASVQDADALGDFYRVFAANMRDLGSPVHGRGFFRSVLEGLGEDARVLLVRSDGLPIGAAILLLHRGVISIPWVSSLRRSFDRCPNQILYWEAIRWGIEHGYRTLDFGRSSRDSGTFEAKRQWGSEPVQLHWHFYPETAPPPVTEVARFGTAAKMWRHLPLGLANAVGPRLRRSIAN